MFYAEQVKDLVFNQRSKRDVAFFAKQGNEGKIGYYLGSFLSNDGFSELEGLAPSTFTKVATIGPFLVASRITRLESFGDLDLEVLFTDSLVRQSASLTWKIRERMISKNILYPSIIPWRQTSRRTSSATRSQ